VHSNKTVSALAVNIFKGQHHGDELAVASGIQEIYKDTDDFQNTVKYGYRKR
jgi:hypothetical protein